MPDTLPVGHRDAVNLARETTTLAESLCTCAQSYGHHARACVTAYLTRPGGLRVLSDALAAHDRRLLAAAEEFCSSCGEALDPDNLCRVNGIPYHLGNCPRPHGADRGNNEPRPTRPPGDDPRAGHLDPRGPRFL